ncbi:hypothetical protein MAHJHV63_48970 [Mycobacterium avium subsp. hominissuis]
MEGRIAKRRPSHQRENKWKLKRVGPLVFGALTLIVVTAALITVDWGAASGGKCDMNSRAPRQLPTIHGAPIC